MAHQKGWFIYHVSNGIEFVKFDDENYDSVWRSRYGAPTKQEALQRYIDAEKKELDDKVKDVKRVTRHVVEAEHLMKTKFGPKTKQRS